LHSTNFRNQRTVSSEMPAFAQLNIDVITDLMNRLIDAKGVLEASLGRLPESEQALKERLVRSIQEIDSTRMRVLKQLVDEGQEDMVDKSEL
jgi:hypothetical protein